MGIHPTVTFASGSGTLKSGASLDSNSEIFGDIVFAENAIGFVDMLVRTGSYNTVSVGAGAHARFSYINLTTEGGHGTPVTALGDGATIELDTDSTSQRAVDAALIGKVGTGGSFGDDVTFQMPADGYLYQGADVGHDGNAVVISDGATVTLQWLEKDAEGFASPITVGTGAKLTLSGSALGAKLLLKQAEESIVLKERSTITFNYCDSGSGNLNKLCLKEDEGVTVNITNTDLDNTQIETPDDSTGTGAGSGSGYLHNCQTEPAGAGITYQTVNGHYKYYWDAAGSEIAVVDDTGNNGTVVLSVHSGVSYKVISIRVDGVEMLTGGKTVGPGEVYTLKNVGGTVVNLTFADTSTEVGGGTTITDTVVNFSDGEAGSAVYHYNHFVVASNQTMVIHLGENSGISANSTFSLGRNSRLVVNGDANAAEFRADLDVVNSGVTIELNGVKMVGYDGGGTDENDAMFDVASGARNVTLKITGDSSIQGIPGADWESNYNSPNSATNEGHTQSAAIRNAGELTIEVTGGNTLTVTGGAAEQARDLARPYYGGAGVYNSATGVLTFSGQGVINVTGGTGGAGYNGANVANTSGVGAENGGKGGTGGFGLYNNGGSVTVTMTSEAWNQGQLILIGGAGGNGGTNGKGGESVSTTNGAGGNSGTAIYNSSGTLVNDRGILLAYTGVTGNAGGYQTSWCSRHYLDHGDGGICGLTGTTTCNGQHLLDHDSQISTTGSDAAYAIEGSSMTVNGGTLYAFGGTGGGRLTELTVNGGTLFGGAKATTGYDGAATADIDPNMVSQTLTVPFTVIKGVKNSAGTPVYFTRIKTGTETGKYLVKGLAVADNGKAVAYGGAGTGMYVNEQGYLYVYLPDGENYADTATLVLKQDGAEVYYQMTCGGSTTHAVQDYGFGDVHSSKTLESAINYDGQSVWGGAFTWNGKDYYNGVNTGWLDSIIDTANARFGWQDDALAAPFGGGARGNGAPDGIIVSTPEHLASLAWAIARNYRGYGAQFADGYYFATGTTTVNLSALLWDTPIGTEATPFTGVLEAATALNVRGLRMPTGYSAAAYGLFGYVGGEQVAHTAYLDGAPSTKLSSRLKGTLLSKLTVDNGDITGNAYVKTLTTDPANPVTPATSGGQYKWTADQLKWSGKVNCMGAIAGSARNATISNCTVTDSTMQSVNPDGTVCAGGVAGTMTGGALTGSVVKKTSVTADCETDGSSAYAGGVVGYADAAEIAGILLVQSGDAAGVEVTADPTGTADAVSTTYAGGVAGYAKNAILRDMPNVYSLDGLTVTATTVTEGSKAYAGGVTGASSGTTYDKVTVSTKDGSTTISAKGYDSSTLGARYAGGLTGASQNDVVTDVSILPYGSNDLVIIATNGNAGGFAARSDGSRFYRSFVRGVKTAGTSHVSMIQAAADTEMYGCYAQGVSGPTHAFHTITGGKYVGCYSTTSSWSTGDDANVNAYNCYYVSGTGDAAAPSDGVVAVTAATLQGGAIAAMNDELLATGSEVLAGDDQTQSGFDWAAAFGRPISYQTDSPPVNGSYPIHGEMVQLLVTVSEGDGYLADNWISVTAANAGHKVVGSNGFYWADRDSTVTITLTAADGVTVSKVEYKVNQAASYTDGGTLLTASGIALGVDTTVDFKLTPTKYYRYQIALLDNQSTPADNGSGSGSAQTVSLSGSTVEKQSALSNSTNDSDWTEVDYSTDHAIHNVILAAGSNADINVPEAALAASGLEAVDVVSGNYKQYRSDTGVSAQAVETLVQASSVTFRNTVSGTTQTGELNLLVSEWSPYGSLKSNFWNGHYYSAETQGVTWAQANGIVRTQRSLLGAMNGSLAVIDSAEENAHVAALNGQTGWIAANDADEEGTWVNAVPNGYHGTADVSYTNWKAGEPNDAGTSGEDYAAINYGGTGLWNDYSGTQALGFFKEYGGVATANASGGSNCYTYALTYTAGGSSGSGGTTNPVNPDVTGVSDLLNTDDHIAFMFGYGDGTFRPDANITRAEVAQMFYNLLKNKSVSGIRHFTDVSGDAWYYDAVTTLANLNILYGVGGGAFAPNRFITRAEFTVVAARFAASVEGRTTFTDVPASHWAYDLIGEAAYYGWITGYGNGIFRPDANITRAEAARVANTMLGRSADVGYVDEHLASLTRFPDVEKSHWAFYDILEAANAHDYARSSGGAESWTK